MDSSQLYEYLLQAKARNANMVLTFDDDDSYTLNDVDLCFSIDRDGSRATEPLVTAFDDCMNDSNKRMQAYRDGVLKTAGVYWTSIAPIQPVNMEYSVENVISIWDDDKNYFVYDRAGVANSAQSPDNKSVNRSCRKRGF